VAKFGIAAGKRTPIAKHGKSGYYFNMKKRIVFRMIMRAALVVTGAVVLFGACSSNPKVTRVDANTQVDLSGYWNDTDARKVAKSLIDMCMSSPRMNMALGKRGSATPVVVVGDFRNNGDEHIDTSIITQFVQDALFNSGKFDFAAGGNVRKQIQKELDYQNNSGSVSEATAKAIGKATGADFLMTGSLRSTVDAVSNKQVRSYFVTGQMYDLETGLLVWSDTDSSIKKEISRSGARF
jgi:uncharacterized protein (TIGR02722 family)